MQEQEASWTCAVCTYHHALPESNFLACKMCGTTQATVLRVRCDPSHKQTSTSTSDGSNSRHDSNSNQRNSSSGRQEVATVSSPTKELQGSNQNQSVSSSKPAVNKELSPRQDQSSSSSGNRSLSWGGLRAPTARDIRPRNVRKALDAPLKPFDYIVVATHYTHLPCRPHVRPITTSRKATFVTQQ